MLPERWPPWLRRSVAWMVLVLAAIVLLTAMFGPILQHL